ncbi:MAG TPA: hypothetical protein VIY29_02470, partial [Ktedonobacteraceae bacterium]
MRSHDEYFQKLDEHSAPTEPLGAPYPPLDPAGIAYEAVPAPTPLERPVPAIDYAPGNPYANRPAAPAYPV